MPAPKICIATGLLLGLFFLAQPFAACAEALKTYYKQYTFFTFENQDYLCEPYQVKKNDWLYKIFRKKGEISVDDFPLFLKIFRRLNPRLSNIDSIEPGSQILIPLRQVNRKAFEAREKGVVEVPVLEFSSEITGSSVSPPQTLAGFSREHTIGKGDTVSTLLDKAFLKKGGAVSETGKKLFQKLNPEVADIDTIYLGSRVLIPDPAILNEPWFQSFLAGGGPAVAVQDSAPPPAAGPALPAMAAGDLARLKRYTQLVQGTLQHQGRMFFPGREGRPAQVLDLAKTPLLSGPEGEKTLILPREGRAAVLGRDLVEGMKAYWKELRVMEIKTLLAGQTRKPGPSALLAGVPDHPHTLIQRVIQATSHTLHPPTPVPVKLGNVAMDLDLPRISHPSRPDVLINPGSLYGAGLAALEADGNAVITLTPGMTGSDILLLLFSKLGFATWKDPAFSANGRVTPLEGIYASREGEKLFVTAAAITEAVSAFLAEEGIKALELSKDDTP